MPETPPDPSARPLERVALDRRRRLLVGEFSERLDDLERDFPMVGSYERVEPYVVAVVQAGHRYELIVYHRESRAWFDRVQREVTLEQVIAHGLFEPGDTVFDLGANSGYLSTWFALHAGPSGLVVAFDPYPWNALACEYSARLNGARVEAVCAAVGGRDGVLVLDLAAANIYSGDAAPESRCFEVDVVRLDRFADLAPTFVKVDIEGAERELLPGAQLVLAGRPAVALELHTTFLRAAGHRPEAVLDDLTAAGYVVHYHGVEGPVYTPGADAPEHVAVFALPSR